MNETIFRHLPRFRLVAEDLNFTATARRLGVSPAAISKSIKTLEEELGMRLFHRSTHALSLTGEGRRLLQQSASHLDALEHALVELTTTPEAPHGLLRIAAPSVIGRRTLLPLLAGFRARYPDITLDLRFDEQITDVVKSGVDVALGSRITPNAAVIAKKLFDARTVVIASPQFVAEHGAPTHPSELKNFPCVGFRLLHTGKQYPWMFRDPETGEASEWTPDCEIVTNNLEVIADLVAAHHGLGLNGITSAMPYFEAGTLVPVMPEWSHEIPPVKIYYSSRKDLPARVRVFIDFVCANATAPQLAT